MIVFDAKLLVAFYTPGHSHQARAVAALAAVATEPRAMSALTLAEFLVHPAASGATTKAEANVKALGIAIRDIQPEDAAPLARLRASTGLKMPDAVVLHLAIKEGASLLTFDDRLAAAARDYGVKVVGAADTQTG
ncbi:MAG: type II toxin-antitoxin system VapC family toxin [Bifidobacteriaceae bacterium]|jgi:predicted nucleic acid-binding protein|nr:type II toxin-antitoxin system VapC family toxin [Bifidobacteriaceae bacterium]